MRNIALPCPSRKLPKRKQGINYVWQMKEPLVGDCHSSPSLVFSARLKRPVNIPIHFHKKISSSIEGSRNGLELVRMPKSPSYLLPWIFPLLLLFTFTSVATAAPSDPLIQPPIHSTKAQVFLVTVGPGQLVWERFGHNGLWIKDPARGINRIYHWGLFNFQSRNFWPKFLKGYMDYSIGSEHPARFFQFNAYHDREVRIQELNLTDNQKNALTSYLLENNTEGNRIYRYNYYLDNCSTRARDAIDTILGGLIFKETKDKGTGTSFRSHTRRLLQEMILPYLGIQLGLGHPADEEISVWEEMFTPMALRRHLNEITLPDGSPLVLSDSLLLKSSSMAEPMEVKSFLFFCVSLSVSVALVIVMLGYVNRSGKKFARILLAMMGGIWGFLSGVFGLVLLLIWLVTEHRFGHWNENLFQYNPLAWVMGMAFVILMFRGNFPKWGVWALNGVAGLSLLGFLIQIVPGMNQVNGEAIALALPIHLAFLWVMHTCVLSTPQKDLGKRP